MKEIQFTKEELKVLKNMVWSRLIDTEGLVAIGVGNKKDVDILNSILKKTKVALLTEE